MDKPLTGIRPRHSAGLVTSQPQGGDRRGCCIGCILATPARPCTGSGRLASHIALCLGRRPSVLRLKGHQRRLQTQVGATTDLGCAAHPFVVYSQSSARSTSVQVTDPAIQECLDTRPAGSASWGPEWVSAPVRPPRPRAAFARCLLRPSPRAPCFIPAIPSYSATGAVPWPHGTGVHARLCRSTTEP